MTHNNVINNKTTRKKEEEKDEKYNWYFSSILQEMHRKTNFLCKLLINLEKLKKKRRSSPSFQLKLVRLIDK